MSILNINLSQSITRGKGRDQFSHFVFWLLLHCRWTVELTGHAEIGRFDSNAADKKSHFRLSSRSTLAPLFWSG